MATMRQIRTRIRVARNIQQITKAMKMVAVARLKRSQDRVQSARPFVSRLSTIVADILASAGPDLEHELTTERTVRTTGVLLVTADRGLCGSYNSAIIRRTLELLADMDPESLRLMVVGRKGSVFFRRRGYTVTELPPINNASPGYGDAVALTDAFRAMYAAGEIDELYVVYTRFLSAITQEPQVERLLPIVPPAAADGPHSQVEWLFEPSLGALVADLLPRYLTTRVYHVLLESAASEHGARMTSMSAATDNAGKMIGTLTLSLNRARQAAITKEISEIVSGAEALKT